VNLAVAYGSAGRLTEAIPLYERTLADRERVLGADHPDTLGSRNNFAVAYESAGRLTDAIPLYERTLADRERVLGADHPDTLTSRNNLAYAYESAGRLTDAIPPHARSGIGAVDCQLGGKEAINSLMAPICLAYEHSSSPNSTPLVIPISDRTAEPAVQQVRLRRSARQPPGHHSITLRDEGSAP